MTTYRYQTQSEARIAAIEYIQTQVSLYPDIPFLFLWSGGSCLQLADMSLNPTDAPRMTLSVVDERWSTDPDINNSLLLSQKQLYTSLRNGGGTFLSLVPQNNESRTEGAQRFEHMLKGWKKDYPTGRILAICGMGKDGHIAGIFAEDSEESFKKKYQSDAWVIEHTHPNAPQCSERITTTGTFLQQIVDDVVLYVTGNEKAELFAKLIDSRPPAYQMPSVLMHSTKHAICFTDIA